MVSVGSARQLVVAEDDEELLLLDELELELELELLELVVPLLLDDPPPPQAASTAAPLEADSQASIRRRPMARWAMRSRSCARP